MTLSSVQRSESAPLADDDTVRILDLTSFRVTQSSRYPAREWAFSVAPHACDRQAFFLFTDFRNTTGTISAADAIHWLEGVLSGRLCTAAIARSVHHLCGLETLSRHDRLQAERDVFAQQFNDEQVKQGLSAFLDKRTAPFSLSQPAAVSLTALLAWVREKSETTRATEHQTRSQ